MKTMRVYRLNNLSPTLFRRLKEAQMEAARVWNVCMEMRHPGTYGPCEVAGCGGLAPSHPRTVCLKCSGGAADFPRLSRHHRDHTYAAPGASRDAHEVSLASDPVLPRQVARPGRPPREGACGLADGERPPISRLAHHATRERRGLHAGVEPGLRVARLHRSGTGK